MNIKNLTSPSLWPRRYDMLDGWRGIAALAVVWHHAQGPQMGHWAVLVFFIISGYCISASADACQEKGLGFGGFMKRRLRRIYPPYLLALLFFALTRLLKVYLYHDNQLAHFSPWQILQNATLTQWLTMLGHPQPVAYENPSLMVVAFWSLNYEEQFYLLVAVMLALPAIFSRLQLPQSILALTALGFVWILFWGRLCYGFFLDYWALFALGALVYLRLSRFAGVWSRRFVDLFLLVLASASGIYALHHPCNSEAVLIAGGGRAVFTELLLGSVFSLLLIASRGLDKAVMASKAGAGLRFLGLISYSLYLIHQFNLRLTSSMARLVLPHGAPQCLSTAVVLCFHVGLASVFWYGCERPFLNKPVAKV